MTGMLRKLRGVGGIALTWVISGLVFAAILAVTERWKQIRDLTARRIAIRGALGGAVIPLLTQVADSNVIFTSPLGLLLAWSSVRVAQRAELKP